ncbi:hypothetical protein EON66_09270, partial [archaeon]
MHTAPVHTAYRTLNSKAGASNRKRAGGRFLPHVLLYPRPCAFSPSSAPAVVHTHAHNRHLRRTRASCRTCIMPLARALRSSRPLRTSLSSILSPPAGKSRIGGADAYGFLVNGIAMRGSVLVFPTFALLWDVQHAHAICPRSLAPVHMVSPQPGANLPPVRRRARMTRFHLQHSHTPRVLVLWANSAELVLVGTGDQSVNLNPSLYAYFSRRGIAVEPMSTVGSSTSARTCQHGTSHHGRSSPAPDPRAVRSRTLQAHAIAEFNVLNEEGRMVAAALISRQPMSRDDASMFVPQLFTSAADKRLQRALARDYTASEASKMLLTDGLGRGVQDRADVTVADDAASESATSQTADTLMASRRRVDAQ